MFIYGKRLTNILAFAKFKYWWVMKLRKIGKVSHISKSGFVVVVADPKNLPKIGSEVYTRKMESIGFVYDIIGPTKSPFVLVKPKKEVLSKVSLEELFVVGGDSDVGGGKGKGGRKGGKGKGDRKEGSWKGGSFRSLSWMRIYPCN